MNKVQLRQAKANLSKIVDAAERGERTIITRHGRDAAAVIPLEPTEQAPAEPNFVEFLMSFPGGIDLDESERPRVRDIDL